MLGFCALVRGNNPEALASGLSPVHEALNKLPVSSSASLSLGLGVGILRGIRHALNCKVLILYS